MEKLSISLDWTPNINHIGFFIAHELGFYKELNLEVEIIDPSSDNYSLTPAKKVELGLVDFALCPTESVISYRTKKKAFDLIAIASVLQEDLSAIVVQADSKISSPKGLDGKTYSSYQARYEDAIVKEMIRNDGGIGELKIIYPSKLGIWEGLLKGEADASWIFMNWEGVEAEESEHSFSYFKMRDYGIPYSYSPVIVAGEKRAEEKRDTYRAFLQASKKGFLYPITEPATSLSILEARIPEKDKSINLTKALKETLPYFGDEKSWGRMEDEQVKKFLDWIQAKGLENSQIELAQLFSKEYLS